MLGTVTRQNICKPEAPEDARGLLLLGALGLHQRDQLAGHEREGHEDRGQDQAGHGEHDLEAVGLRATGPRRPCRPKSRMNTMPEITGETPKGRSIRVMSAFLPGKSNFAIAQAAATPKTRLSGTATAAP